MLLVGLGLWISLYCGFVACALFGLVVWYTVVCCAGAVIGSSALVYVGLVI